MSSQFLHEVCQLTRAKARSHYKFLIILWCSLSALLTFTFFYLGVVQKDPLYGDLPVGMSAPLIIIGSFNMLGFFSIGILFLKSLGECSAPKVVEGYWNVASKFILRERFKKNMANGIWDYVKLHRKHDPIYQADLQKLEEKIELNNKHNDQKIDSVIREIRIKNLALEKERNLRKQAERERNQAIQRSQKLTRLIIILSKSIIKLRKEIKKPRGE